MTDPIPHAQGRRLLLYREVLEWIEALPPGKLWIYHVDGEERCLATLAAVWQAYQDGKVTPVQKRDEQGRLLYVARRRGSECRA